MVLCHLMLLRAYLKMVWGTVYVLWRCYPVGHQRVTFAECYWSSSASLLLQLRPALARWILVHTEDMNWNTWTCQLYFSGQGKFLQWTATCVTLSTQIGLQHTNKLFSYCTREVNKDIVYSATLFWGCYRANEGLCISPRAVICYIFQ